jgi:hypothetical protein
MRRLIVPVFLGVLLASAAFVLGQGGGRRGGRVFQQAVLPYHALSIPATFPGGEIARVVASGTGQTYMGLYVYDAHGNCVAWDDLGNAMTKDDLAVQWLPPAAAPYRIEIRNYGPYPNVVTVSVQ